MYFFIIIKLAQDHYLMLEKRFMELRNQFRDNGRQVSGRITPNMKWKLQEIFLLLNFQRVQKFLFRHLLHNILELEMIIINFLNQLEDSVREIEILMLNIINYWSYNLKKGLFTTYTI